MAIRAECLERLIDPRTNRAIAAYGWIKEERELPGKYWVSIGNRTPDFFSNEEQAKQFYRDSIVSLTARLRLRGLRGYGNNRLVYAASVKR